MAPDSVEGTHLSYKVREMLSWMTAGYLLLLVDEPVHLEVRYPFEGHYDCLDVVRPDGVSAVRMNRLGDSAFVDNEVVTGIWEEAGVREGSSPDHLAVHLLSESDLAAHPDVTPSAQALAVLAIGNWLNEHAGRRPQVWPVWENARESVDVTGPATGLLSAFDVPTAWLAQPSPGPGVGPEGWLFVLAAGGEPELMVNTRTGESIRRTGGRPAGLPTIAYRPDGTPGCPLGLQMTAMMNGQLVAELTVRVHERRRYMRLYSEEGCHPVTFEPIFTVPSGVSWDPPAPLPPGYLD